MPDPNISEHLRKHEIPGRVALTRGNGGLTKAVITAQAATAEIYLHGAHLTHFQKSGGPPLLFLSGKSHFAPDKPIRGGVPVCFPWFGGREGLPAHGFARLVEWELIETATLPDGGVKVRFQLPENSGGANAFHGKVEFSVTVNDKLTMELKVTNTSAGQVSFEECLHTYFNVGDIGDVSVTGLKGTAFLDKVGGLFHKVETDEAIRFQAETDRVYLDTTGAVEIHDTRLRRKIRVKKSGSASTVVWNPWVAKSKAMPDFGDDEFHRMVCVESGNVGQNQITLAPGKTAALRVELDSTPLP
jgi:glucose-6-phosphate 1-epimerase